MNSLEIIRQNGNVPRSLAGEDHITGFIAYLEVIPESFRDNHVQAVSTIDKAESLGITADADSWALRVLHYQLSAAAVHQSIGWVKQFPTGITLPAFGDGTLLRTLDKAMIEQLDSARYLFLITQIGQAGSFVNDSHTMDSPTSDYAMIENVRTMDKAVRGIRTYLIPELGGNVYIDSSTGKLQPSSVAHLETIANRALEDMEKAGELSGYKVVIDPEQDVLSTNTVEILIKQVAVGVMRKIKVKIGFYKSV